MQRPIEWHPKQVALAVYVYRFGDDDLGMPLPNVLELVGLSQGQWQTRLQLDFPALVGTGRHVEPSERLRGQWQRLRQMSREDLRAEVLSYFQAMKRRKGL